MPAKPSGEVKTSVVYMQRKNGDRYVLERKIRYDPQTHRNKILATKLLGKIPNGSTELIHTRPKRKHLEVSASTVSATRMHVGMMNIVEHIGKASGIDDALYAATDPGTAQKILSVARYLLCTDGRSLPDLQNWQLTHPLPYEEGITEDIYGELFPRIGRDEALQQSFFQARAATLEEGDALAYDSTSISTYGDSMAEARYGLNQNGDDLKIIKLLTLYSIKQRQPVVFTKQSGNLPDVITVNNALRQLQAINVNAGEIITDNGYCSEQNMVMYLQSGFDFVTLAQTGLKWIREELANHIGELQAVTSLCPDDPSVHGITVRLVREFKKVRKYANHNKGLEKGSEETFRRRIFLHLYFSVQRHDEYRLAFDHNLCEIKRLLEQGQELSNLSERGQQQANKYLVIQTAADGAVKVTFNASACAEAYKYHGYFALVTNCETDPFECLRKYRRRETIEAFFRAVKQTADGARPRVRSPDALRGRMFTQFIALCYREYLAEEIRKLKATLGKPNGNADHDTKTNLLAEEKLKAWLKRTPLGMQLRWFDATEAVTVSSAAGIKRWTTEITARDRLYLTKLGITAG